PNPGSRRYRCRRAGLPKSRSLLLKEPQHGQPLAHCHAPPRGLCSNQNRFRSAPLDAQFVESLLILSRERVLFDVLAVRLDTLYFQISEISDYRYFALDRRRLAKNRRHQQPSLSIDLHHLSVIVRAVQELLFGGIEIREPRQLFLDPLPLLEGIYLSNLSV